LCDTREGLSLPPHLRQVRCSAWCTFEIERAQLAEQRRFLGKRVAIGLPKEI
jgi:hypothetical protein